MHKHRMKAISHQRAPLSKCRGYKPYGFSCFRLQIDLELLLQLGCRGSDGQALTADANNPDNQMIAIGGPVVCSPVKDFLDAAFIAVRPETLLQFDWDGLAWFHMLSSSATIE